MTGYVYMLTAPDGRKYIGRTTDYKRRMRNYATEYRRHKRLVDRLIQAYGFNNFKREILETVEGDKLYVNRVLNEREKFYIEKYDTVNNGLNICRWDTHDRCYSLSDATKEKMRKSQTGRKHSLESRVKRAGINAYQGKRVRSETLGKTFYTLREAAHYAGIGNGCKISECINGLRKSAGRHPLTGEKISDWEYV